MLRPRWVTFMPLVPRASWSLIGVLSQTSTPSKAASPRHVVIFDEDDAVAQVRCLAN